MPSQSENHVDRSRNDGRVIVLAEDSEELRQLLASALERSGHRVIQVGTGPALVDEIRRVVVHKEAPGHIDLVISDVRMPGMTGLTALKLLRDADLDVPMILMTAFGDLWTRAEAAEYGAAILQKPVPIAVLRDLVQEQLRR